MTVLRPAAVGDIEAMGRLHAASFPQRETWSPTVLALQMDLAGVFGLIAGDRGFVLARAVAGEAEILTLAVDPASRRAGIGTALLTAANAQAGCMGASEMFLEVATTNEAALALYAALGFREVGQRRAYYADGGDALVLRAELTPRASGASCPVGVSRRGGSAGN